MHESAPLPYVHVASRTLPTEERPAQRPPGIPVRELQGVHAGVGGSLLALGGLDLVRLLHDLAKHDNTVAVQERDAAQALAVLERVDDERLLRREGQLRHLVRLQRVRLRPSQFLNVSTTSGCCGVKVNSAISFDFSECGSSIFLPPVSLPIFQTIFEMRHADLPHRTKPIGEYPTLISLGMSSTWICALNSFVCPKVVSFLYTITSPERGMLFLSRPLMFKPTLSPGLAKSTRVWCISTVKTLPRSGDVIVSF